MKPWVVALCAIRFDLEQGQLIEYSVPQNALTTAEESHVAFSAFPDSSPVQHQVHRVLTQVQDSIYFFRIPRQDGSKLGSFLYGYVFNRQRHDERLKRGGEQKSVVILSLLPYWSVFKTLVQIAGPLFFDIGSEALVKISDSVSGWPAPSFGSSMELPVLNMVIRAGLPPFQALPPDLQRMLPVPRSLQEELSGSQGIFHDVHLFGMLKGVLLQLWLLWELALIGEPLLILAPSPSVSSLAVASVGSLIAPVPLSSDFRPYFTIHDPEFKSLLTNSDSGKFPPIILGVTNLHFCKSLPKFPNVLCLQGPPLTQQQQQRQQQQSRILQFLQRTNNNNNKGSSLFSSQQKNQQQQIWNSYVPVTKPDTSVLNKLVLDDHGAVPPSPRMDESMSFVNTEILRRHFAELTNNFLAPLVPYLRPTAPPGRDSSPFVDPPPLPAFDVGSFLASLSLRGPGKFLSKRLRPNWIDLYSRFLKGPNFQPWFQARRSAAEKEQLRLWKLARARVEIRLLVNNLSELQLVDLFHAIRRHIHTELQVNSGTSTVCDKLRNDLRVVFSSLRKDMQQLLLSNPQHASLLQVHTTSLSREPGNVKVPGRPSICITYPSEAPLLPGLNTPFGKLAQELARDPLDLETS